MFSFMLPLLVIYAFSLPALISALLTNSTIDDQDFSLITYAPQDAWMHDPLVGWESDFNNGSRSYTYTPGANASFTFTGSGIYLQGPYAPDQARRRVFLDGEDMGQYGAYAEERSPSTVFWGTGSLVYTTHTVVVAHNDSSDLIFAMDAWIVEFDPLETPLPYSTTTISVTTTPFTLTLSTSTSSTEWDDLSKPHNYSTIIIAAIVPVLLLLVCCIGGICFWRHRRTNRRQDRQALFREKFFRHPNAVYLHGPNSPMYGRRSSVESRPMSPRTMHTIASTQYETALDHLNNTPSSNQTSAQIVPASPTSDLLSRASPVTPTSTSLNPPPRNPTARNSNVPTSLYIPPLEWRTAPTFLNPTPPEQRDDAYSPEPTPPTRRPSSLSGSNMPSAWVNLVDRRLSTNRPSTVFSESDSNFSSAPPPLTRTLPQTQSRPTSTIRRLSAALVSPFTRASSRNSVHMVSNRNSVQPTLRDGQNVEGSGPGYFRGINHFNLGIPLNYRPVATASSPVRVEFPRHSQYLEGGGSSGGARTPSRAGIDELAFSNYLRDHQEMVGESTTDHSTLEEEKPEKILESITGDTMREDESTHERERNYNSSLDHGSSDVSRDLTRNGSLLSRQLELNSDPSRHATPPPYSIYIPPDTKRPSSD